MAYTSNSRGGGSRGGSRGGGGGGGGGGSSNTIAYVVAIALVGGVIGLVFALGKKGEPAKPPAAPAKKVEVIQQGPAIPAAKPYPDMPKDKQAEAQRLSSSFEADSMRADRLYAESLKAKKTGDDALWQSKLKEAGAIYHEILDKWNDFIGSLPSNGYYDAEQVVAFYFPRENGLVAKYTKALGNMKADER